MEGVLVLAFTSVAVAVLGVLSNRFGADSRVSDPAAPEHGILAV